MTTRLVGTGSQEEEEEEEVKEVVEVNGGEKEGEEGWPETRRSLLCISITQRHEYQSGVADLKLRERKRGRGGGGRTDRSLWGNDEAEAEDEGNNWRMHHLFQPWTAGKWKQTCWNETLLRRFSIRGKNTPPDSSSLVEVLNRSNLKKPSDYNASILHLFMKQSVRGQRFWPAVHLQPGSISSVCSNLAETLTGQITIFMIYVDKLQRRDAELLSLW